MRETTEPVDASPGTQPASFEAVYRASWASTVRLGVLLTGSRQVAEDLAHDAFLRLAPSLERVAKPEAYLRATVVNLVHDRHRRLTREDRNLRTVGPGVVGPADLDETWLALQALAPKYRTALILRFYVDLPVDEIAGLMRCRPGTAKSLIHRGLRQLKEKLEP